MMCMRLRRCPGCKHPIKKAEDQAAAASSEVPAVTDTAQPAASAEAATEDKQATEEQQEPGAASETS